RRADVRRVHTRHRTARQSGGAAAVARRLDAEWHVRGRARQLPDRLDPAPRRRRRARGAHRRSPARRRPAERSLPGRRAHRLRAAAGRPASRAQAAAAAMIDPMTDAQDPIALFSERFGQAATTCREPDAMVLSTVDADGRPSGRFVLLKAVDARGFVFYTNMASRKARELLANPSASLTFYWPPD